MTARRQGDVEKTYRAWVATLGALSPRQQATVAQVYALARQLDASHTSEQPLSAVAAVSRELRQIAGEIRDAAVPATPDAPAAPVDQVDQVAAKRAERRAERQGRAARVDGP